MIQVMIQEKQRLTGNLSTKQSLSSSLNNAVIYIDPITQEKEVTPSKQTQEVVPDIGYTGLSKVIVNSYTPLVSSKKITSNGIYKANDDNLDGYSQVCVETNGVDINDYFLTTPQTFSGIVKYITKIPELDTSGLTNMAYMFDGCTNLSSIPNLNTSKVELMNNAFSRCSNLVSIPNLNTSKVESMSYLFAGCSNLVSIPQLDTSNVTTMYGMFRGCKALVSIPELDTSNVTTMETMFHGCYKITSIPELNTSNVTTMEEMFCFCSSLVQAPQIDTSNVVSIRSMFNSCSQLKTVPLFDSSKVEYINLIFNDCKNLENVGGFQNLGQAYKTTESANYYSYKLSFTECTNLTEQSLINVLTNLYDIATKGCNTQTVQSGPKNIAKLTSTAGQAALTQATNYGWTIS